MSASIYFRELLGSHTLRDSTFVKPVALYIGLLTTVADSEGAGWVEVSGAGYSRVACAPGDANWGVSGATFSNRVDIDFPSPTGDWGTIVGFGLFNSSSGNYYFVGGSFSPIPFYSGGPAPSFLSGSLVIQF